MKKIIITILVILVIAVIAVGAFLLVNNNDDPKQSSSNQNNSHTTDESHENHDEMTGHHENNQAAAVITYADDGFSVDTQTVSAGDTIEIINNSSETLDFASDVHPTHTDNSEFNVGTIEPGESTTFTVSETGEWGFHNHLNSSHTGKITVE